MQSSFHVDARLPHALSQSPGEWFGRSDSRCDSWPKLRLGFTLEFPRSVLPPFRSHLRDASPLGLLVQASPCSLLPAFRWRVDTPRFPLARGESSNETRGHIASDWRSSTSILRHLRPVDVMVEVCTFFCLKAPSAPARANPLGLPLRSRSILTLIILPTDVLEGGKARPRFGDQVPLRRNAVALWFRRPMSFRRSSFRSASESCVLVYWSSFLMFCPTRTRCPVAQGYHAVWQ